MLKFENIISHYAIVNNCKLDMNTIYYKVKRHEKALVSLKDAHDKGVDVGYVYELLERSIVDLISELLDIKGIKNFKTCSELHYTQTTQLDSWINFEMGIFYYGRRRLELAEDLRDIVTIIIQEF